MNLRRTAVLRTSPHTNNATAYVHTHAGGGAAAAASAAARSTFHAASRRSTVRWTYARSLRPQRPAYFHRWRSPALIWPSFAPLYLRTHRSERPSKRQAARTRALSPLRSELSARSASARRRRARSRSSEAAAAPSPSTRSTECCASSVASSASPSARYARARSAWSAPAARTLAPPSAALHRAIVARATSTGRSAARRAVAPAATPTTGPTSASSAAPRGARDAADPTGEIAPGVLGATAAHASAHTIAPSSSASRTRGPPPRCCGAARAYCRIRSSQSCFPAS